jgi:hypothetical protein
MRVLLCSVVALVGERPQLHSQGSQRGRWPVANACPNKRGRASEDARDADAERESLVLRVWRPRGADGPASAGEPRPWSRAAPDSSQADARPRAPRRARPMASSDRHRYRPQSAAYHGCEYVDDRAAHACSGTKRASQPTLARPPLGTSSRCPPDGVWRHRDFCFLLEASSSVMARTPHRAGSCLAHATRRLEE